MRDEPFAIDPGDGFARQIAGLSHQEGNGGSRQWAGLVERAGGGKGRAHAGENRVSLRTGCELDHGQQVIGMMAGVMASEHVGIERFPFEHGLEVPCRGCRRRGRPCECRPVACPIRCSDG